MTVRCRGDDGPLPWPGGLGTTRRAASDIRQFFVNTTFVRSSDGPVFTDSLSILLQDGEVIPLVTLERHFGVGSWRSSPPPGYAEQLLALEASLEQHLGIEDQEVVSNVPWITTYGARTENHSGAVHAGSPSWGANTEQMLVLGLLVLVSFAASGAFAWRFLMNRDGNAAMRLMNLGKSSLEEVDRKLHNRGLTSKQMTRLAPQRNFELFQPVNGKMGSCRGWQKTHAMMGTPLLSPVSRCPAVRS
ncbi:MAG: hypothetical protein VX768_06530 [Planctomycetota bacterium]|nr:hypothetical protein [Planctomycetota bacterium]